MKFNVGDRIRSNEPSDFKIGVIDNVDRRDTSLPYHIKWDDGQFQWISEPFITKYTPKRRFQTRDTVYSYTYGKGVISYSEAENYSGYLHHRVNFENGEIIWVSDKLEGVDEHRIIHPYNINQVKPKIETEMKETYSAVSNMHTIIVEFEGSDRKYTYNTSAEVKEADKIRVPSQRGGSFVTITVVRVLDNLFKYVNRQTGDLLNEFTNSNCIDIKTLEIGQPKTDVVIGYKI